MGPSEWLQAAVCTRHKLPVLKVAMEKTLGESQEGQADVYIPVTYLSEETASTRYHKYKFE